MLTTAHCQNIPVWLPSWLADMGSTWVKTVNAPPYWVPPGGQKHCCRIWTDSTDAQYLSRGREGGRDYVRTMFPRWQQNPSECFALWNEPPCNSNEELVNLREATLGAVDEAIHLAIKLVGIEKSEGSPGDNGSGDPGVSAWKLAQLRPAVKALADAGMYYGGHYYYRPGVEGPTGRWHALGRLAWDLETLNIPNLKTLVTECGIDGGIAGYPGQQGWRVLTSEDAYRNEIIEAERYARTIPGIEALMVFGFGAQSPWESFDVPEGFARGMVAPLRAVGELVTMPQPDPPEDADGRLTIELARPLALTPATNKVTQWFGENPGMYAQFGMAGHNGLDYRAPEGTPVLAAHPGIVRVYDEGNKGLGKYVKVTYIDGAGAQRYTTYYAHLSQHKVVMGQRVRRGDVLGLSGNTGNSTGAHLHFGLKVVGMVNPAYNDAIDPVPWRTL